MQDFGSVHVPLLLEFEEAEERQTQNKYMKLGAKVKWMPDYIRKARMVAPNILFSLRCQLRCYEELSLSVHLADQYKQQDGR